MKTLLAEETMDKFLEIGLPYGIDKLYSENSDVSVTGFDKCAVKKIKQKLNR